MGFPAADVEHYRLLDLHFDDVAAFYKDAVEKSEPVFVHCVAGINRSVTIVVALLIAVEKMTLTAAVKHVAAQRGIQVLINDGFCLQLVEFAKKHGKLQ
jgi:protein-tyrosine phosphatase